MNSDGSNQKNLTRQNFVDDMLPSWSPDGSKIVFVSNRNGNFEIYVMNADGSNQTNLTNNSSTDSDPAWFNILLSQVKEIHKPLDHFPEGFKLLQNYPNPFNPVTTIKFQIPRSSFVDLKIYNISGQEIKSLIRRQMEPGYFSIEWDGTNKSGNFVSSGTYLYILSTGSIIKTNKMMLVK